MDGHKTWESLGTACCSVSSPLPRSDAQAAELLAVLKALADEARLAIMELLARHGEPLCVCHIVTAFELSQPTISHHLRLLREAGLVTTEKRGLWVYYSLRPEALRLVAEALTAMASPLSASTAQIRGGE